MPHLRSTLFACALAMASMPVSAMAAAPALTGAAVVPKTAPNVPQIPPSSRATQGMPGSTGIPTKAPTLDPPGSGNNNASRDTTVIPPNVGPILDPPR